MTLSTSARKPRQYRLCYIGVVPLATGLIGWCPAYTLLGMNSCPIKK